MGSASKADTDEKMGEFWDSHDFTELDTDAPDADFDVISTFTRSSHAVAASGQVIFKRAVVKLLAARAQHLQCLRLAPEVPCNP